jgi:hypothetical protein
LSDERAGSQCEFCAAARGVQGCNRVSAGKIDGVSASVDFKLLEQGAAFQCCNCWRLLLIASALHFGARATELQFRGNAGTSSHCLVCFSNKWKAGIVGV